jgi:hypothetical protein
MTLVTDGNIQPTGYQQLTGLDTVQGLNSQGGRIALIQAAQKAVRWRDDGVDPTDTIGMLLEAGRDFWYTGDVTKIKFIEVGNGAEINVSFYR